MFELDTIEMESVSGGTSLPPIEPIKLKTVRAQDMYGDTMSRDAWDDHIAAGGDPFDFPGGKGD